LGVWINCNTLAPTDTFRQRKPKKKKEFTSVNIDPSTSPSLYKPNPNFFRLTVIFMDSTSPTSEIGEKKDKHKFFALLGNFLPI
jgi:hypothetical protein